MSNVEYGEFKGNKVIILKRDDRDDYPLTLGARKAKVVLQYLEEIKQFVAANQKK